jgi:hypothetical protein
VQWMICLACATNDLAMCIMPTPSRDGRLVYVICRRCEGRRVLPRETGEREETRRRREAALRQGPQAARRGKGAHGHTGHRP